MITNKYNTTRQATIGDQAFPAAMSSASNFLQISIREIQSPLHSVEN